MVRVDCGSICKLLSVDNSSSGRVGLDDAPVIAYANAAFVTLFWRRRRLCFNIYFCVNMFLCVRTYGCVVFGVSVGRSHWIVILELVLLYGGDDSKMWNESHQKKIE